MSLVSKLPSTSFFPDLPSTSPLHQRLFHQGNAFISSSLENETEFDPHDEFVDFSYCTRHIAAE